MNEDDLSAEVDLLATLTRFRQRLFAAVKAVLFVLMLSLFVLIILQVFSRYVLQSSLPWTEEIARMVIVWAVMLGAAVATDRGEHYAITALSARFGGPLHEVVLIVTSLLGLVFLVALIYYGALYMIANANTTYVATRSSRAWVYLALPVGAGIMALSLVLVTAEAIILRRRASVSASSKK